MDKQIEAIKRAVEHAIRSMGLAEFKKTSFFLRNTRNKRTGTV